MAVDELRALAKAQGLLAPLLALEEEADARDMQIDELRVQVKQLQLAAQEGAAAGAAGASDALEAKQVRGTAARCLRAMPRTQHLTAVHVLRLPKELARKDQQLDRLEDEKSELRIELGELKIRELQLQKELKLCQAELADSRAALAESVPVPEAMAPPPIPSRDAPSGVTSPPPSLTPPPPPPPPVIDAAPRRLPSPAPVHLLPCLRLRPC